MAFQVFYLTLLPLISCGFCLAVSIFYKGCYRLIATCSPVAFLAYTLPVLGLPANPIVWWYPRLDLIFPRSGRSSPGSFRYGSLHVLTEKNSPPIGFLIDFGFKSQYISK